MKKYMYLFVCLMLIGFLIPGAGMAQGLDMEFKQAPIADVYQILGEIAGYNVLIDPSVEGTVSFYLKDLSVREALDLISRTTGYGYEIVNNTLVVASDHKLQSEFTSAEFMFLQLNNVNVADARQLMSVVAPSVNVYSDQENNLIVLYGAREQLNHAKNILEEYDVISQGLLGGNPFGLHPGGNEAGLQNYRMPLNYGNGAAILRSIQRTFPYREFTWDDHLHLISGVTTAEEWELVMAIIMEQDVPDFLVKGIIGDGSGAKTLVLVEYNGNTSLVAEGSSIAGWRLTEVLEKEVVFSRDDHSFRVTMGR